MTDRARDSTIMIVAMLVWATVMLAHPSHAASPPLLWRFGLSDLVHGTALILKPVLLYGAWRMAIRLGIHRPLIGLGLASFSLAIVAMLAAAAISAFVTPLVPELFGSNPHGAPTGHAPSSMAATTLGLFSWLINQAFARFYVTLASLAILFWAFAWRRDDVLNQAIAVLGIAVGGGILLWQLSGQFQPRPGPMMFVAVGHAGWFVLAAARLLTSVDAWEQSNA